MTPSRALASLKQLAEDLETPASYRAEYRALILARVRADLPGIIRALERSPIKAGCERPRRRVRG